MRASHPTRRCSAAKLPVFSTLARAGRIYVTRRIRE
jgi:hypothetical protein